MNEFDAYLNKIMKGTFLRTSEKAAWLEEIQAHLEEAVENYKLSGLSDEQAQQKAMRSFGKTKEIHRHIVRETFAISPRWYLLGAVLCFLAAVAALFTTMRFDDAVVAVGDPTAWKHLSNPLLVSWLHRYLPLNSNRWVVLGVTCSMMVFTRNRTDRLAVLVSWIPFATQMLPSSWGMWFSNAVTLPDALHVALVAVLATILFFRTRNLMVSMAPWAMSIAISTVTFGWHLIQSTLSHWTGNPIFWGLAPVTWGDAFLTFSSIACRVLMAVTFAMTMGKIQSQLNNRATVI